MVQAYKEQKYELTNGLRRKIELDKKLYNTVDLFVIKLKICVWLVRIKAPLSVVEKVQRM